MLTGGLCVAADSCLGLYNTPPARAGAGSPSSAAGEHEQRRRGEQEGRMNEKGSERIGGAEFILCLAGLHFFLYLGC